MSAKLFCSDCAANAMRAGNAVAVPQHKFIDRCYGCGSDAASQAYEVILKKPEKK